MPRYKLKLKQLDFISAVDEPAQETAKVLLIKRKGDVAPAHAKVAKVDEALGLVFCWAFTSKAQGADYYDLHGDCIEPDFIEACAAFMEGSRSVDEMHDGKAIGKTVFGMPMTPEIAKAFLGIDVDTIGFMVAIKPGADALAKFKSGEYSGVSIAGWGEREKLASRKNTGVAKSAVYTTEVDGHQHTIDLDCFYEGAGYTSHNKSTDDEWGHTHSVVRGADGSLTILADTGHTHELAEGQAAVVVVPANAVVVVSARSGEDGTNKSTHRSAPPSVDITQEPSMPDNSPEIADLKKQLATALALASLSDAQRAHHKSITGADAENFLAKSPSERDGIVKAIAKAKLDADPEHYLAKSGRVYRQSERELGDMAKRLDESDDRVSKREVELETERLTKRADVEISHFGKSVTARAALLRAIDGIADEAVRKEVQEAVKGANAIIADVKKFRGVNPGEDAYSNPGDALDEFNKGVAAFAKKNEIKDEGLALEKFLGTTEGRALKKSYDATRAYGKQP
ncbi:MAG: hypothetical protein H0U12_07160 [Thermoleophilaceae bacterium]|nr:hypothetical protein [Thermoleophilaceae bacterium]